MFFAVAVAVAVAVTVARHPCAPLLVASSSCITSMSLHSERAARSMFSPSAVLSAHYCVHYTTPMSCEFPANRLAFSGAHPLGNLQFRLLRADSIVRGCPGLIQQKVHVRYVHLQSVQGGRQVRSTISVNWTRLGGQTWTSPLRLTMQSGRRASTKVTKCRRCALRLYAHELRRTLQLRRQASLHQHRDFLYDCKYRFCMMAAAPNIFCVDACWI